jgi:hypothetical protein
MVKFKFIAIILTTSSLARGWALKQLADRLKEKA